MLKIMLGGPHWCVTWYNWLCRYSVHVHVCLVLSGECTLMEVHYMYGICIQLVHYNYDPVNHASSACK